MPIRTRTVPRRRIEKPATELIKFERIRWRLPLLIERIIEDPIQTKLVFNPKQTFESIGREEGADYTHVKNRWLTLKRWAEQIKTEPRFRKKEFRRFLSRVIINAIMWEYHNLIYSSILKMMKGNKGRANYLASTVRKELLERFSSYDGGPLKSFILKNVSSIVTRTIEGYKLKKESASLKKKSKKLDKLDKRLYRQGIKLIRLARKMPQQTRRK